MPRVGKRKRQDPSRDARRFAHEHAQREEGRWLGQVGQDHPVAKAVIARFNETSQGRRGCPHLQDNLDQAQFWVEAVPELLACAECTLTLAAEEQRRANSRCIFCRRHVELRGVTNGRQDRGALRRLPPLLRGARSRDLTINPK